MDSRRVKYTKMIIRESFLELLAKKPLGTISVTDICKKADINRGTFYAHYRTTADLLDQIENELLEIIRNSFVEVDSGERKLVFVIQDILESLKKYENLCRVLFGEFGAQEFILKVQNMLSDMTIQTWNNVSGSISKEQEPWLLDFVTYGSVSIIKRWVQGGMKSSTREIARFIERLTRFCFRACENYPLQKE